MRRRDLHPVLGLSETFGHEISAIDNCFHCLRNSSTPRVFSYSCAGNCPRRQFEANSSYGDKTDIAEPGTYMIVLKKVDVEKIQCVPISFTAVERKAIRKYVVDRLYKVVEG